MQETDVRPGSASVTFEDLGGKTRYTARVRR
jgi:hypothetical protein